MQWCYLLYLTVVVSCERSFNYDRRYNCSWPDLTACLCSLIEPFDVILNKVQPPCYGKIIHVFLLWYSSDLQNTHGIVWYLGMWYTSMQESMHLQDFMYLHIVMSDKLSCGCKNETYFSKKNVLKIVPATCHTTCGSNRV